MLGGQWLVHTLLMRFMVSWFSAHPVHCACGRPFFPLLLLLLQDLWGEVMLLLVEEKDREKEKELLTSMGTLRRATTARRPSIIPKGVATTPGSTTTTADGPGSGGLLEGGGEGGVLSPGGPSDGAGLIVPEPVQNVQKTVDKLQVRGYNGWLCRGRTYSALTNAAAARDEQRT
jgi:hypothetical protein